MEHHHPARPSRPRPPSGLHVTREQVEAALNRKATAVQARLDAVVALARKWATQPTDWDEDTEQQIEDGTELLTLLGLTLEEQP